MKFNFKLFSEAEKEKGDKDKEVKVDKIDKDKPLDVDKEALAATISKAVQAEIEKSKNQSDEDHAEDAEKGQEVDGEKLKVSIDSFVGKVLACKTLEGLDELEDFYLMRREKVSLEPTDDITIRDSINGRREELEPEDEGDDVEDF